MPIFVNNNVILCYYKCEIGGFSMNKQELRIQSIVKDLILQPNQTNAALAEKYNVSTMTIRRDLDYIEKHHLLDSARINISELDYEANIEEIKNSVYKERIAHQALKHIEANDILILDDGTTAGTIAALLPSDIPLTVICYSYHIVSKLYNKENIKLIMAGGYYHRNTQAFESPESVEFIKKFRAKKMFVCASGVHEELGLTCADQRTAANKQAALSASLEKILVTDSSKFGMISAGYFAPLDQMDLIITDSELSPDWKQRLNQLDISYELV